MLDAQAALDRRLLEADLVTGALELSALHNHGIPEGRRENFSEAPAALLGRLLATVEPSDLSPSAGALWARVRAVWKKHRKLSWPLIESGGSSGTRKEAAWMREHGLAMGLHAPGAAKRLLELSAATESFREAQQAASIALEAARVAVRGA